MTPAAVNSAGNRYPDRRYPGCGAVTREAFRALKGPTSLYALNLYGFACWAQTSDPMINSKRIAPFLGQTLVKVILMTPILYAINRSDLRVNCAGAYDDTSSKKIYKMLCIQYIKLNIHK